MEKVFIPQNVLEIEISAFSNCESLECIECEIDVKPKLWDPRWNQINKIHEEYYKREDFYKTRWGVKKQN